MSAAQVNVGPLLPVQRVSKLLRDDLEKIAGEIAELADQSPSAEEMLNFAARIRAAAYGCDQILQSVTGILAEIRDLVGSA